MMCVYVCTLQEAAHSRELAQWDAQIRARNDELTQLTSENTRCLTAVAEYTRSQMDMEDTLTNTQVRICHCNVTSHVMLLHVVTGLCVVWRLQHWRVLKLCKMSNSAIEGVTFLLRGCRELCILDGHSRVLCCDAGFCI